MSKPQPNAKEAYDAGAKAKRQGFGRVTPYYNQPRSDYWWLAGFDGVEFFEAERKQPEYATQILTAQQARGFGVPVPEGVDGVHVHGGTFGTIGVNTDGVPSLTVEHSE